MSVLCRKPCVHSDSPQTFVSMQRMVCTVYVLLAVFDAGILTQICAVGIMSYICYSITLPVCIVCMLLYIASYMTVTVCDFNYV